MTTPATWSPGDQPVRQADPVVHPPVGAIGHLVVVPRTAGPLVDVDGRTTDTADEIDAAIDELFGTETDGSAGPLDAALVVGGLSLAGWSLLTAAAAPLFALGIGAVLLGIALPAHAVATDARARRRATARARAVGDGLALDASDPTVHALVDAYGACLGAATAPGLPYARDAAEAAHLAVVEVASLLGGGHPMADAEVEYVRKRTQAIGRLTLRLQRARRSRVEARLDADIHRTSPQQVWATALTEAREELEATGGLGSLDRLEAVGSTIEGEASDARR